MRMKDTFSVIYCLYCKSPTAYVVGWESETRTTLRCRSCSRIGTAEGFTVGRYMAEAGDPTIRDILKVTEQDRVELMEAHDPGVFSDDDSKE